MSWVQCGRGLGLSIFFVVASSALASDFNFDRETFAFANATVFEYRNGVIVRMTGRRKEKSERYTRRCFVMSRAVVQFHKFARFDGKAAPLDDKELAARIRRVCHKQPWHDPLPPDKRIVFPYANLREMSKTRGRILQENIGLGWPTYGRIGNFRMFFNHSIRYQEKTQAELEATLRRGEMFVAYLSDYPTLHINHSVLVYAKKPAPNGGKIDKYICYDPNHPDAPRELSWSRELRVFNYVKDEEFVGGYTRVYHVYGKPWQ